MNQPANEQGAKGLRKQVRQALLRRPEWVEPGVLLQDQPLMLADGRKVRLHGVDIEGRPCLVGVFRELDAKAYDWMLASLCAFRDGMLGRDPVYSRGHEPRLFVVAPWFRPEDLSRLRLIGRDGSVRALRLRHLGEQEFRTELVFPATEFPNADAWVEQAPQELRGFCRRLLAAARRGPDRFEFQGVAWPVLIAGEQGPVAALHLQGSTPRFLAVGDAGMPPRVIELTTEAGQDDAVDHLLRSGGTFACHLSEPAAST